MIISRRIVLPSYVYFCIQIVPVEAMYLHLNWYYSYLQVDYLGYCQIADVYNIYLLTGSFTWSNVSNK